MSSEEIVPDVLVVPDSISNRDFPSVAAGLLSAFWNVPVIDYNTLSVNEEWRLFKGGYSKYGFVVPSRAYSEMKRLTKILKKHNRNFIIGTANGPIDIQCCYPLLKTETRFECKIEFGDVLPFPDYSRFDTFEHILFNWQQGRWFYPIMTSLGCPFGCIYCASRKRKQYFRSVQHCIEELVIAKERWGIKRFVVVDDCFNSNIERAKIFSEQVASLGLEWMAGNGLRADRFDKELAALMRDSGCRWVSFGVESTDDYVLSLINKGETFEQINRATIIAKQYFCHVNVFLILGLPGSSYESDRKTIEWAKLRNLGIHVSFYIPFDQGMQLDCLFDIPEGRRLPKTYSKDLQLKLYYWAKGEVH